MIRLKGRANEGDGIPNLRALNRRIFFHSEYGVRNLGKRRPPALPSPRGEGGIRRSHARRMTDEVSCREGWGMLPQTAQGRNSSGFPTAAEIAGFLPLPPAAGGCKRLAVPEKPFGLSLILRFFDRCGNCGPPLSAAGGGGPQFLIILNSGGGDCFLLVTCGIVCPSKDETEKRREDAC